MANNRIAYGIAQGLGINTDGMSPKEVWAAIKRKKGQSKTAVSKEEESNKTGDSNDYTEEQYKRAKERIKKYVKNNKQINKRFEINGVKYRVVQPKEFIKALTAAKASVPEFDRWRVDIHDEADYAKDKLFVTQGGSCVAVEPNGNVISVCKNYNEKIRGSVLLDIAVANGGNRLDAFGEGLYNFYTKNGFEPVSWTPFNEQYAPEGWKKKRDDLEPVIFYKLANKKVETTYEDFLEKTKYHSEYSEAELKRDKEIK